MKETMKYVSHQQARQLLHNKFIVVLGDSIQRGVYKDLVLILQKEKYLSASQLKSKGEMSFERDCLVEGGTMDKMHNGTEYREVRQFRSDHHLLRFYFVTRIYSTYMRSVLEDLRRGLKPDVIIINSCVWDISRYLCNWVDNYKMNLHKFFDELKGILPQETLVIWSLTMPLADKPKGGFLVPEIEHKAAQLNHDVIRANFYSATLADTHGMDVLDLHFQFRLALQHRTRDGIHWNALAHRRITSLLLEHTAKAWGVILLCQPTTVETNAFTIQSNSSGKSTKYANKRHAVFSQNDPPNHYRGDQGFGYEFPRPPPHISFQNSWGTRPPLLPRLAVLPPPQLRPPLPPPPHWAPHGNPAPGPSYRPPAHQHQHHQYVMRNRRGRHHYAPYTQHRPHRNPTHSHYYYH